MTDIFSFNLIDQPWIPVLDEEGRRITVSLREVLINAYKYRQLAATLPQTNAALYRLLLAILYAAYGPIDPERWEQIWLAGAFNQTTIDAYLTKVYHRFDLFSPDWPFYQHRNPLVEKKPVVALLFNTGGGNPETLFDHHTDDTGLILTPAEAALALVTVQSFSLAGLCHPQLKLVYTDAPCSRAAVILLQGNNLFESLMLNLVEYNAKKPMSIVGKDAPAWEMENAMQQRTVPRGYMDYLTWQNRSVMLFPEMVNGEVMVTRVSLAPGLVLDAGVFNPMHHYRKNEKAKPDQPAYKVLRFTEGKALWRDSSALLANIAAEARLPAAIPWVKRLMGDEILPRRKLILAAYGMATEPGKSKVLFYRGEQFEFSNELLDRQDLVDKLDQALNMASQIHYFVMRSIDQMIALKVAPGSNLPSEHKPNLESVKELVTHLNPDGLYWQNLEIPFHKFLYALFVQPEEALENWKKELKNIALTTRDTMSRQIGNSGKELKAGATGMGFFIGDLNKYLDYEKEISLNYE